MAFHIGKQDLFLRKIHIFIASNSLPQIFHILWKVCHRYIFFNDFFVCRQLEQMFPQKTYFFLELFRLVELGW